MVLLGGTALRGGMGNKDPLAPQALLESLDHLDPKMGVPFTPGGGRAPALKLLALSYSTPASLEEPTTV